MSNAALAALDARLFDAFARVGLSEPASTSSLQRLSPRGQAPQPCRVTLTRAVQQVGGETQISAPITTVALLLADIGTEPADGDIVAIGGERWKVDAVIERDESRVICVVVPA